MADFSQLIADVQAVIRENGRQLITGPVLQSTLIEIINTINADKQDPLNIVDALIAGSTDPVTSGAVEAAVSGLGIDLANEVNARIAADALLIPKADIVQTLGTATDKVPSVDLLRSQVALLQTAIGAKWTRPTVVSFDDAPDPNPIATYNGVDYYSQMDLFNAIVAQGSGGVAADTSVLAALGITPELITGANGAGSAGLIIEQKQLEIFWRSLFVKSENEYDGDYGYYYDFRDGEYWLSFHVERPEGQPATITGNFSRDEELHRSDIEQTTGISLSRVMSQKAVTDALAGKQATISDLDAIRAGALLGSTAYQLPVGGIPFEDLEHSVQVFLEKADNSLQPNPDYDGQIPVYNEDGYIEGAGITPADVNNKADKDGTYPDLTSGAVLGAPVPAEFAYRGAPYGGSAVVDTVLGNSVKWNQLIPISEIGASQSGSGITITNNNDGSVTISGTATADVDFRMVQIYDVNTNHKYILPPISGESAETYFIRTGYGQNGVFTPANAFCPLDIVVKSGASVNVKYYFQLHDLTAIFGSGNEPSTVSEFEAWMAQNGFAGLTDYNPGQVLGNAAKNLKTAGFNLWDEEWEEGGIDGNGNKTSQPDNIRTKNYNPCAAGATYYVKATELVIYFYDSNKTMILYTGPGAYLNGIDITDGNTFVVPNGACYFRFRAPSYGTTYNNDICINLSGPRNGQYEPYVGAIDTIALNLSTLTGIPEGGGSSEVVFPLGLQSIGGVSDEIHGTKAVKRFGVVDLGSLNWIYDSVGQYFYSSPPAIKIGGYAILICGKYASGALYTSDDKSITASEYHANGEINVYDSDYSDTATFKTAMDGVMLVYELATPIEYTLDQPLPALYETAEGGPEYIEGPAGTAPTTAPFVGEIRYSQPQADANGLAVAILDALKDASKISSYTFGIDPETSKPAITIS